MHAITISEKEAKNLKESGKGFMEVGFGGRKGKGDML